VSKEHLLNLLCRVYVREISADEAFDELEDLIDRIKRLEEGGDKAILNSYLPDRLAVWNKAKEAKL
jgi:hypothetical protein